MGLKENNVPSTKQVDSGKQTFFLGNPSADLRILIVGNSITFHLPKESIGWMGSWGMAASCMDKDYVHVLADAVTARHDAYIMVRQLSVFEASVNDKSCDVTDYRDEKEFGADIVIYRLGDNVKTDVDAAYLYECVGNLISYLAKDNAKIILTSGFWKHPVCDDVAKRLARERGAEFVYLGDLDDKPEMKAYGKFDHSGVAAHPGDEGMREIAARIFDKIVPYL